MAKTNYTKVEGSFDEGLRKMMVEQLLNEADINQGTNDGSTPPNSEKKKAVLALHHSLRYLHKAGLEPYKKMKIKRKKLAEWIEHPEKITAAEWKLILGYKQAVDRVKKPPAPAAPAQPQATSATNLASAPSTPAQPSPDDALVTTARKKSVYKRFNINEKWLPLQ